MYNPLNYPRLLFLFAFAVLWFATRAGALMRRGREIDPKVLADFSTILVTTLTLNGLILGFSFSMAISRYEHRKTYEEAEANAIGTEYARADLLPGADGDKVRSLLREYTAQRVDFYTLTDPEKHLQIVGRIVRLQNDLWAAVVGAAGAQPTPIIALTVAGMNDVLNSEGYTQAAWWNRIPTGAWALMAAIAITSQLLIGYVAERAKARGVLYAVLPFVIAIAFMLIADIDSPRRGIINVQPQNLIRLLNSIKPP